MRKILSVFVLLTLSGCVQPQLGEPDSGLREFYRADVQRALDLAERTNDELAVNCYTYLLTRVPDNPVSLLEEGGERKFGVVTAYQVARTARRSVSGIRSAEYFQACGPMEMESRAAVRRGILKAISPF